MVEFLKIRDVKSPKRSFGDAGIDCFVPSKNDKLIDDLYNCNVTMYEFGWVDTEEGIILKAGKSVLIPMGIKSKFAPNIALMANNKSGVATKKNLIYGAQLIDSSYQGEIHAHMINVGDRDQLIEWGSKIIQFVPVFIDTDELSISEDADTFYTEKTSRGEGGFGSTGTK